MKTYEDKAVTHMEHTLVETSCDLCGTTTKSDSWAHDVYEVNTVEIMQQDGSSYPETGSGTEYAVDMCPVCFKTKLIPWLESQGCTAKRVKWNW